MKVIQVCNWHRVRGGRELVAEETTNFLKRRGHAVLLATRDSEELGRGLVRKIHAFVCGLYSLSDRRFIAKLICDFRPDIIHVHGLHPLFSPWSLVECRSANVPVVLTCHEYHLTCPTNLHLHNGIVCERCASGREYWCVLKNCRKNTFESLAYSLHSTVARKLRLYHDNVSIFVALTQFAKRSLIAAGFADERIAVLPNMVSIPDSPTDPSNGEYIAYVGRMGSEKGVDTLLAAASRLPELCVQLAGEGAAIGELVTKASRNVSFVGRLDRARIAAFYRKARFVVVPSKGFEMCPLVISEAMAHGLPIIASRIGGLPEMVEDGFTGFLFEPGNSQDLASKMKLLWESPDLCREMGRAGREKAIQEYSEDVYYKRLMILYRKALATSRSK